MLVEMRVARKKGKERVKANMDEKTKVRRVMDARGF